MTLFVAERHERLRALEWDEGRVRDTIEHIVRATEAAFSPDTYWPTHALDAEPGETQPVYPLYFGACGVIWALHYLQALAGITLQRSYAGFIDDLLPKTQEWLQTSGNASFASYLMGDIGIRLVSSWLNPTVANDAELEALIAGNVDHPSRELMWGAPGTLLAALFLHERTGDSRWADLYRATARTLRSQLLWSPEQGCHYWTQDMYGRTSTYIDAVHGFAGTALPLIRGRELMAPGEWNAWREIIVATIERCATREGPFVNWRAFLFGPVPYYLMQYCHGAPGFVVCLADLPGTDLDDLLTGAGEAMWAAGPLVKGSNLCHGTGGNGYALLKLYRRTRDPRWLDRARAFAMHGIDQTEAHERKYACMRYSLWTGDLGFAIYLWDCIRGVAAFPTVDVFYAS